jgi:hypothetical protein
VPEVDRYTGQMHYVAGPSPGGSEAAPLPGLPVPRRADAEITGYSGCG